MKKNLLLVIFSLMISAGLFAQTQVSGVVKNSDGKTVPGVTVIVKGTQIATASDVDGKYSVSVPDGYSTLVFRGVGLKTQEVAIGGRTTIDVNMNIDAIGLDEVVVTALGISREEKSLGYSIQEVNNEDLTRGGENNVIQALAAKSAGVQVISSSGTPGASSKILLRGNSTFTGNNQPLIVIDGIPMDNETRSSIGRDYPFNENLSFVNYSNRALDINPDDIESVTVLKGPAAAALYGYQAGNGAIIITTKKGKGSRGLTASYSVSLEISQVNKLPDLQDEYAQGSGGGTFYVDSVSGANVFNEGTYTPADPGPDLIHGTDDDVSLGTANSWGPRIDDVDSIDRFNNMDEFFQTGVSWKNTLSVMGGDDKNSFRLSLHRLTQNGIVPNSGFERNSVRFSATSTINDKLSFSGTANYIKSGGTLVQNGSNLSGVMLGLLRAPASFDLMGDGDEGYKYASGAQRQYFFVYDNPWWSVYENPFTSNLNRMIGNISATYQAFPWMDITYKVGTDFYNDSRKQIYAIYSWDPNSAPFGQVSDDNQNYRQLYGDLMINMSRDLTDNIAGTLTLGQNMEHEYFQDQFSRGQFLAVPDFYNLSNASDLYTSEYKAITRTAAVYADANLDINRYLYLGLTGRVDWSSTFGENKRSFPFYSGRISFIPTELMNENDILSFAKIRLAYTSAGIAPPPYMTNTVYVQPFFTDGFTDGVTFPYDGVNGFGYSDLLGNADLEPERVKGPELGLDLRFFGGRLNLDFTYYNQKSTNLLIQRPIASSTGFEAVFSNAGEMVNKGIEIIASGSPIKTENFEWNIMVNFSKNTNEVLALVEGVDEIDIEAAFSSIGSYAIVGDPYGALYATQWVRNDAGQLVINRATGLPYVAQQRGNVGNPYPDWLMGITNTFTYRDLSLSGVLDIRQGGDIWCGTCARIQRYGRTAESADRERTYLIDGVYAQLDGNGDVIKDDNDDPVASTESNTTEISAFSYYNTFVGDNGGATENAVFDGSWVRLREIALTYKVDLKDAPVISSLDLGIRARNLWLSTDYPGVDPETSLTGAGSNVGGFDYFNNPGAKSYVFSLTANFR